MAKANQQNRANKRTIIIPKGTLNADETTIIHIPLKLNNTAPLLVTNYRDDTYLKVQSLPIWNDELAVEDLCYPDIHFQTEGPGCTDKEVLFTTLNASKEPGETCTNNLDFEYAEETDQEYDQTLGPPPEEDFSPQACSSGIDMYDAGGVEQYQMQPGHPAQQLTSASSGRYEPSCCYDVSNPNITYDFRPITECDYSQDNTRY